MSATNGETKETTATTIEPKPETIQQSNENQQQASAQPADENVETGQESAEADASLLRKLLRSRIDDASSEIEVERENPNSPLYSAKSFEELNLKQELLMGLYAMGFTKPSKIQETALPALVNNPPQNLIAQSQSGTGKTAAFVLAMLSRIDINSNYPQAICLAPTMELAAQIADVVKKMSQYLVGLTIVLGIKGTFVERNVPLTNHIVIGTPGTILDWTTRLNVINIRKVKAFVLDEADIMIATQGHQDYCIRIVRCLSKECQLMLFSATYTPEVIQFATKIIKDPFIIRLRRHEEAVNYIKQFYATCNTDEEKVSAVYDLLSLNTVGQAIVFCETKRSARELSVRLNNDNYSVELLSGELDVGQRVSVIERFREGKTKVLVTTNVTARGIDIEDVSMVINFDLPVNRQNEPDYETYLHRIGRTGRFGKKGIAVNLVSNSSMQIMNSIQKHFQYPIKHLDFSDPEQVSKLGEK